MRDAQGNIGWRHIGERAHQEQIEIILEEIRVHLARWEGRQERGRKIMGYPVCSLNST